MKRLYIDLDGVLLTRIANTATLAPHAAEFLTFVLKRFDCYWCSAGSLFDFSAIAEAAQPHLPADLVDKLQAVRPAESANLKTDVMTGDFYWIDDSPIAAEVSDLCRRGALDRWIEVNTRVRHDDLLRAMDELTRALARDPAPPRRPANRHPTLFPQWIATN